MKQLLKLLVVILSASIFTTTAYSQDPDLAFTVFQQSGSGGNYDIEPDKEGNRMPGRPITVSIDRENGVTVPGYDTADILAYEVYTEDGGMVASFVDEQDFIGFIFSAVGVYEIRLRFEEVTLAGFLSL